MKSHSHLPLSNSLQDTFTTYLLSSVAEGDADSIATNGYSRLFLFHEASLVSMLT